MAEEAPHWHVDGPNIREETTLGGPGQGLVHQWVVPFIVDSGPAKGSQHEVRVSPADFTAAGVKQAIAETLNSVHQTASLSSLSA